MLAGFVGKGFVMGRIYEAFDTTNFQRYIGKVSGKMWNRRKFHVWDAGSGLKTYFHKALCKRPGAFVWKIVEDGIPDDQLNDREIYWIKELDTYIPNVMD